MIWRAVRMEWTKLRTVRTTPLLILAISGLTLGLGWVVIWSVGATACPSETGCAGEDAPRLALSGVYLAQVAVVLFAALTITSEYATDMMRVTLAATPRRAVVLAAKVTVVLGFVVLAGAVGVLGSLAAGRVALPGRRFVGTNAIPLLSLSDESTARAALGTVLYLGLVALLSLAVAVIVRHTPAALSTTLAVLYLPPMIAPLLTNEHWREWIMKASPMMAGLSIQATKGLETLPIAPWPGLGVLAAYAGGAFILGAVAFTIRDA
jgi:ABC-2 type transport system permease protein